MRIKHLTAVVALALTCVLAGACLQPNGAERIGEAQQEAGGPRYGSKDFPFKVTVKDDGEGKAGGYQTAEVSDAFTVLRWPPPSYRWECHYKVRMPIRAEAYGRITADRAALWSAEAANAVVFPLLDSTDWTGDGTAFCRSLNHLLAAKLNAEHPKLGASVMKDQ
jgi:hypothetical protein